MNYPMRIHCSCGKDYDAPRQIIVYCPHCKAKWDTDPPRPGGTNMENWKEIKRAASKS